MLKLYDETKTAITELPNIYDYYIEEAINTLPTLHFKYGLDNSDVDSIREEGYVRAPYLSDDSNDWFVIKEVRKDFNELDVMCVLDHSQFNYTHFYKLNFGTSYETVTKTRKDKKGHTHTKKVKVKVDTKKTCDDALDLIIDKSSLDTAGWLYVDSRSDKKQAKKRVFKVTKCTPWTAFLKTVKVWNYEWLINNDDKAIYLYDKVGGDKGAYFIEELNLTNLEVDKNSNGVITRLYPYGKTLNKVIKGDKVSCTITVNGAIKASTGDTITTADAAVDSSDNKVTTKYLENRSTINKKILAHKTWSDIDDSQDLYDEALDYLEEHCKPTIAYTASVTDLSNNSEYSALSYSIGDTVHLTSKTTGVRGTFRIVQLVRYPLEPSKNTCTLANKKTNLVNYLKSAEAANSVINEVVGSDTTTNGVVIEEGSINNNGIGEGEIGSANVDMLTAEEIDCDTLVADTGFIENLTTDNAFITNLTANNAFIDDLTANNAFIGKLDATDINADRIKTGTLNASLVNVSGLTADKIVAGTLGADVVFGGTINGDKITSGTIDASKVHMVNLDASTITTGVLTADKILLRGTDKSLVYDLNNISGATQTISNDKLNGEILNDKTITAKQIDVGNLTADTGFINNLSANTALINQIQANVLDVDKLNALGIKAGRVDAENITGNTISAKTLSGCTIQSTDGTSSTTMTGGYLTISNPARYAELYLGNNSTDNTDKGSKIAAKYNLTISTQNSDGDVEIYSGSNGIVSIAGEDGMNARNIMLSGNVIIDSSDVTFNSPAKVIRNWKENQVLNPLSSSGNVALSTNDSGNGDTNIYAGGKIVLQTTCKTSSGATVTSDRNMKENIFPVDDKYIKLFDELKPVTFEYKNGASGRTHLGYIAQDVKAAMDDVGLSDKDFAGWCKDKNNNELEENRATNDDGSYPEYTYALRYDELTMLAAAKVKQLDNRVKQLEAEIQELKANK